MAKFKLSAGAEIDLLTKEEMTDALNDAAAREAARLAGVKDYRFFLSGTVASSAITLGDPSTGSVGGVVQAPQQGYIQTVKHLVIEGLTSGATFDTIAVYRNNRIVWYVTGNQPAFTFGSGQLILKPGEALYFKNSGNLTATGQIIVHGTAWNVPAELIGKLF